MPFRYAPTPWEFIRRHLSGMPSEDAPDAKPEDYIENMLKAYNRILKSKELRPCAYPTFSGYVWVLKRLGLIYLTRREPVLERPDLHDVIGKVQIIAGAHRHYYALVTGQESAISWVKPREALARLLVSSEART